MKRIALYVPCPSCEGHGRMPDQSHRPRTRLCPGCQGAGLALTKDGRAITDLIRAAKAEEMLPDF
ncbi:hypothetical protein P12x_005858 [Tundrisphaera lichenicola]|uniref:hypothetical protein n=1 Tax=Tundrisphaera lichenicola TaxID=2029860 RepID=UPI003EBB0483